MKHFGDGENISEDSFFRVFYIQDNWVRKYIDGYDFDV